VLGSHRRRRPWRAFAYASLGIAGGILLYDPTRNIAPLPWYFRWLISSFLVLGALGSVWGTITDKWIGEFACLPLILAAVGTMFIVLAFGQGTTGRLFVNCFAAYILITVGGRWIGLLKFVRQLMRAKREGLQ
jgi:hypothetical protein